VPWTKLGNDQLKSVLGVELGLKSKFIDLFFSSLMMTFASLTSPQKLTKVALGFSLTWLLAQVLIA